MTILQFIMLNREQVIIIKKVFVSGQPFLIVLCHAKKMSLKNVSEAWHIPTEKYFAFKEGPGS